jgi:hypothetical protein
MAQKYAPASTETALVLSHARIPLASPRGAGHGYDQGMLTIPLIASSFGASTNGRDRIAQENRA